MSELDELHEMHRIRAEQEAQAKGGIENQNDPNNPHLWDWVVIFFWWYVVNFVLWIAYNPELSAILSAVVTAFICTMVHKGIRTSAYDHKRKANASSSQGD